MVWRLQVFLSLLTPLQPKVEICLLLQISPLSGILRSIQILGVCIHISQSHLACAKAHSHTYSRSCAHSRKWLSCQAHVCTFATVWAFSYQRCMFLSEAFFMTTSVSHRNYHLADRRGFLLNWKTMWQHTEGSDKCHTSLIPWYIKSILNAKQCNRYCEWIWVMPCLLVHFEIF